MKVLLLRKSHLTVALGILLTAALFFAVNTLPASVAVSATTRQLPIYCVDRDDNMVAISFDAAWGNEDTQQLIDTLARYHVKTTFFVVGEWVEKYPESVKALHDAGHEIMNHSDNHAHYNTLSTQEIIADVNTCNDKIEAITGVRPTLIRCPYGEYDDHVIAAIRSMGMEPVQWDVETLAAIGKPCGATISGQMYPSQPLRLLSHVFFTKSSPCILIHGELFINQSWSNTIYDAAVSHRTVMRAEPPTVQENSVSGHSPAVIFSISVGCSNSVPAT